MQHPKDRHRGGFLHQEKEESDLDFMRYFSVES